MTKTTDDNLTTCNTVALFGELLNREHDNAAQGLLLDTLSELRRSHEAKPVGEHAADYDRLLDATKGMLTLVRELSARVDPNHRLVIDHIDGHLEEFADMWDSQRSHWESEFKHFLPEVV